MKQFFFILLIIWAQGCSLSPKPDDWKVLNTRPSLLSRTLSGGSETGDTTKIEAGRDVTEDISTAEEDEETVFKNLLESAEKHFQAEEYPQALKQFRIHNKNFPKGRHRSHVLKRIGQLCVKLGFIRQAVGVFKRLKKENAALDDREVDFMLGESYFKLGEYSKALSFYKESRNWGRKSGKLSFINYKIAAGLFDLKKYEQALPELLSVTGKTGIPAAENDIKAMLSCIYALRGDYLQALAYSESFLKDTEAVNPLVDGCLSRLVADAQVELLEKLVTGYPDNPGYFEPLGETHFRLAEIYAREGRKIQASDFLEHLINSYPKYSKIDRAKEKYRSFKIYNRKIGVIIPLTGEYQVFGRQVLNGIELAVEKANRKLDRHARLALIIKDSEGDEQKAEQAARELIKTDQVIAVIGPVLSKTTKAAAVTAEELETLLITPSAGEAGIPEIGHNIFRNALTNQHQGVTIAEFAINRLCQKEFGILYPDNPYGRELMTIFKNRVEELGGQILTVNGYDEEATDFKPQIEIIHQMNPKVLFIPDFYQKIIMIAPQLAYYQPEETLDEDEKTILDDRFFEWDKGLDSLKSPSPQTELKLKQFLKTDESKSKAAKNKFILLGTDGWNSPKLVKEGSKYLEGAVFASGFSRQGSSPQVKNFVRDFKRRFRKPPEQLAAQSFDAADFVISAINEGNCTREMVRDYLASIRNYQGVSGLTSMLDSGESDKRLSLLTARRGKIKQLRDNESWFCSANLTPRLYAKLKAGNYDIESDTEGTLPELELLKRREKASGKQTEKTREIPDDVSSLLPSVLTEEEIPITERTGSSATPETESFLDEIDPASLY